MTSNYLKRIASAALALSLLSSPVVAEGRDIFGGYGFGSGVRLGGGHAEILMAKPLSGLRSNHTPAPILNDLSGNRERGLSQLGLPQVWTDPQRGTPVENPMAQVLEEMDLPGGLDALFGEPALVNTRAAAAVQTGLTPRRVMGTNR